MHPTERIAADHSIFISFEGGEGTGKSTQVKALIDRLAGAGYPTLGVHEPGSTPLGWYLRRYLKDQHHISKEAELLLFAAARAELVNNVIRPNLERGIVVVADRFGASTIAYQGFGRKINLEPLGFINSFVIGNTEPDLTILLDIDPEEGLRRVGQLQLPLPLEPSSEPYVMRREHEGQRLFEEQPLDFHRRVRDGYLQLARMNPEKWSVIPAYGRVQEISDTVWDAVSPLLASSSLGQGFDEKEQPLLWSEEGLSPSYLTS